MFNLILTGESMFTSEKTGTTFRLRNCDKFFSLHTAYNGIEPSLFTNNFFNQNIEKHFLKMIFTFLEDVKGKLLFVVAIGKNNKEVDRLIPTDPYEAVAFANLISQISADQRVHCRNCNPKFKSCIVIEIIKNYKKKLATGTNS